MTSILVFILSSKAYNLVSIVLVIVIAKRWNIASIASIVAGVVVSALGFILSISSAKSAAKKDIGVKMIVMMVKPRTTMESNLL